MKGLMIAICLLFSACSREPIKVTKMSKYDYSLSLEPIGLALANQPENIDRLLIESKNICGNFDIINTISDRYGQVTFLQIRCKE